MINIKHTNTALRKNIEFLCGEGAAHVSVTIRNEDLPYGSVTTIVPIEILVGLAKLLEHRNSTVVHDTGPHSRACGMNCQGHGPACHSNCPTCHGQPLTELASENCHCYSIAGDSNDLSGTPMITITITAIGWKCSAEDNELHKTITGSAASRDAWIHMTTHDGKLKIKDERINSEWTRNNR